MALLDPIQLRVAAYVAPTGGTLSDFGRVTEGVYVSRASTSDEPWHLYIKSAPVTNNNAKQRVEIQLRGQKNVAAVAGVLQQTQPTDDILSVAIVVNRIPRSFTATDVQACIAQIYTLCDLTTMTRVLNGEK